MTQAQVRVGEQRPGGRAARVRAAVLRATSELLTEVGYERLTVDEVAGRAGVHKTTVYRRWPTKPELVADAVIAHAELNVPIPDTGSLSGDLRALARDVVATIASPGGALQARSIVAAAAGADDLAATVHSFWAARMAAARIIVERAIERGEISADSDPLLVIESLVAPIWLRLLVTGEPIDDAFADRLAAFTTSAATRHRRQRDPARRRGSMGPAS